MEIPFLEGSYKKKILYSLRKVPALSECPLSESARPPPPKKRASCASSVRICIAPLPCLSLVSLPSATMPSDSMRTLFAATLVGLLATPGLAAPPSTSATWRAEEGGCGPKIKITIEVAGVDTASRVPLWAIIRTPPTSDEFSDDGDDAPIPLEAVYWSNQSSTPTATEHLIPLDSFEAGETYRLVFNRTCSDLRSPSKC